MKEHMVSSANRKRNGSKSMANECRVTTPQLHKRGMRSYDGYRRYLYENRVQCDMIPISINNKKKRYDTISIF